MGIEPASSAWEADILPMNYVRPRGKSCVECFICQTRLHILLYTRSRAMSILKFCSGDGKFKKSKKILQFYEEKNINRPYPS